MRKHRWKIFNYIKRRYINLYTDVVVKLFQGNISTQY